MSSVIWSKSTLFVYTLRQFWRVYMCWARNDLLFILIKMNMWFFTQIWSYLFDRTLACVWMCVCLCANMCASMCMRVCVRACVRAYVRACVRACVHACVRAYVCTYLRAQDLCVFYSVHLCQHNNYARGRMRVWTRACVRTYNYVCARRASASCFPLIVIRVGFAICLQSVTHPAIYVGERKATVLLVCSRPHKRSRPIDDKETVGWNSW